MGQAFFFNVPYVGVLHIAQAENISLLYATYRSNPHTLPRKKRHHYASIKPDVYVAHTGLIDAPVFQGDDGPSAC